MIGDSKTQSYIRFPFLSGDVSRPPPYSIYIFQFMRFAELAFLIFIKNIQITSLTQCKRYVYHKLWKTFGKIFQILLWIHQNVVHYHSENM